MSTITYTGVVLNITQCCGNGTYGTDFNGFFGTPGASIVGLPYSITWIGQDGAVNGAVLGASITINNHTFTADLSGTIYDSEFTDVFWPALDQVQGSSNGRSFSITTDSSQGLGVFYLDGGSSFRTQAFLQVPAPAPVIGSGIEMLPIAILILLGWKLKHARS